MSTRIRLQRHGRKGRPIFTIVVADQRAKRDGKFIEKLGQYNPNTDPATIELNFDRAVEWVIKGAQPTHTARALLSYKGVLLKKHLIEGVRKGALTEEQMDERFNKWLEEKESLIQSKRERLANESAAQRKARLEAEAEANTKRQAAIAAKNAPAPEVSEEAPEGESAPEAAVEEAPAAEEATEARAEETTDVAPLEEPVQEDESPEAATKEAPAVDEVKTEEASAPATEEAPANEDVATDEAPAASEEDASATPQSGETEEKAE